MAVGRPSHAPAGGSSLDRLPPVGKFALGVIFVVLVAALYFVAFYEDLSSELANARDREGALRAELTRAEASKAAYQRDLDEKIRREQVGREQKKVLPDESETPAFLSSLQSAALISGVNLTSWSPIEEAPQEFYAKVPMKLTLSGKFHQVAKFFHAVGQLDRIINIENIQIKTVTGDKESPEAEINVDCLATAFRAVRVAEAGAPKRRGQGK